MEPTIAAEGLVRRFRGGVLALDGVDLTVRPGEVVAVLGRNGAGKSTLLRVLATLVLPEAGRASIAGHDVVSDPRGARRSLGLMLGDERSLWWRLTGQQNLELFCRLHGMRASGARDRSARLLASVGLTHAGGRRAGTYSSGMRARLALARAFVSSPPALLLDEPTRSVDLPGRHGFGDLLRRLADERGAAILLVTHDVDEAAALAGRAIVMAGGRVVAETGDPQPEALAAALEDNP